MGVAGPDDSGRIGGLEVAGVGFFIKILVKKLKDDLSVFVYLILF